MQYPLRKCGCGDEHECALLDPVANGKRGWERRKNLMGLPSGETVRKIVARPEIPEEVVAVVERRSEKSGARKNPVRPSVESRPAEKYQCSTHRKFEPSCEYCQLAKELA